MRRPLRRRPTAAGSATATAAPRAWLLALALAGCGGPSFDGTVYRGQDVAFRVPAAPASWRQISVSDAAVAYRDDANGATIAVNGRCRNEEDVPLISLTNHLFLHFTEREVLKQEVVPFDDIAVLPLICPRECAAYGDGVGRYLQHPVPVDGVVQPAHEPSSLVAGKPRP